MKYIITNIIYSIETEDIDAYRESEGISESVTDEEVKQEIQNSLLPYLIVEPDDDNDDLEEALNNAISDETGWCIETYVATELVEYVVSQLNNFMEFDAEFWMNEFGCDAEDIVNLYGFGYDAKNRLAYLSVDEYTLVPIDLEEIALQIAPIHESSHDLTDAEIQKMRDLILWIFDVSEAAESAKTESTTPNYKDMPFSLNYLPDFEVRRDPKTGKYYYSDDAEHYQEVELCAKLVYDINHDFQHSDHIMMTLFENNICGEEICDDHIEYLWFKFKEEK